MKLLNVLTIVLVLACLGAGPATKPFDPANDIISDPLMLFRALPAEAQHDAGIWDQVSGAAARKWFESLANAKLKLNATVESVSLRELKPRDAASPTWEITLRINPLEIPLAKTTAARVLLFNVSILTDDATAKAATKWASGDSVSFSGAVRKVAFSTLYIEKRNRFEKKKYDHSAEVIIHVEGCELHSVGKWKATK